MLKKRGVRFGYIETRKEMCNNATCVRILLWISSEFSITFSLHLGSVLRRKIGQIISNYLVKLKCHLKLLRVVDYIPNLKTCL